MVTPFFLPQIGGVESHVYQVSKRLAGAGINVTVLTTDLLGRLPFKEELEGITIRRVRAWPAKQDYYFAPDIYRIIRRGGWDLIHVQCYHTLVAPTAMLAARRAKIPYVVTFHGGGHSTRLRNALRGVQLALLRPLLSRAEQLVAVARFEIEFFGGHLRLPPERFVYIPNGADLPKVPHNDWLTATNGTIIASVGRLERYKGHHRIMAALPYILEQRPEVRLWIAGAGPYEPALRRLARRLGVTQHVEIRSIPVTERERMAVELSKVALVVLLSEYETHPSAVLEALSLAKQVLVAATSGLSELADQGLVRAIPLECSSRQVAAVVLDQLRHPPKTPMKLELPTWDNCAAGLLALYQTVIERSKCVS